MSSQMLRTAAFSILFFLGAFTATAFAQGVVTDGSLADLAKPVLDAVVNGHGWYAAALAVVLLCALAKRFMPASWAEGAKGDVIGVGLVFTMATAAAVGTVLAVPDAVFSWAVLHAAMKVGIGAAGGYTILHKLASALVATDWYKAKAPAWLQMVVAFLLSAIGSDAIPKAEAAGAAAVAAKPADGIAGPEGVREVS